ATFQNILQQRRALETIDIAGQYVDHQHLFNRQRLTRRFRLFFLVLDWRQQGRHGLICRQVQIALLRLDVAPAIEFTGTHGRHVRLVEGGLALAINNPSRAKQVRVAIGIRQVAEAVVQLEPQLAATTTHATPAIKQNADDDDDPYDDQPIAQLHETPKPLNDEKYNKNKGFLPL